MVRCVKVPKKDGESVRARLVEADALDTDHRIRSEGDCLLIPTVVDSFEGYEMVDAELQGIEHKETDYKRVVSIPEELRAALPSSFDIIGDVAVMKLPDELLPYKDEIGAALMETTSNLRVVMLDHGVKGELRVRDLERIAGDGGTVTEHREFGVRMLVDPSKMYFNPRLSTERMRVASMVKDGEVIIDMFAGVAPFPLVIRKHANPLEIYAIDLNHDAVEFMRRNIELNGMDGIVPIEGDATVEILKLPMADRVIMNLPQIASRFLPDALNRTKSGGTVHMHMICERDDVDATANGLVGYMCARGAACKLSKITELKTYSPSMSVYVLDIIRK